MPVQPQHVTEIKPVSYLLKSSDSSPLSDTKWWMLPGRILFHMMAEGLTHSFHLAPVCTHVCSSRLIETAVLSARAQTAIHLCVSVCSTTLQRFLIFLFLYAPSHIPVAHRNSEYLALFHGYILNRLVNETKQSRQGISWRKASAL